MPADLPPQPAAIADTPRPTTHRGMGALGAAPQPPPQARQVYPLAPVPAFSLLASPLAWDVFEVEDGVHEILPALQALNYTPGQKGVAQVKDPVSGKLVGDPVMAIARLRRRGYIEVPRTWTVRLYDANGAHVGDRTDYVHAIQGNRGTVHLDVWTRPYLLGDQVFFEKDKKGWFEFLRRVRDEILGGQPDPQVAKALRAKLAGMARVSAEKAHHSPSARRTTDVLSGKLEAFEQPTTKGKRR